MNKRFNFSGIILLLMLFMTSAYSQKALSLDEAIHQALNNNYNIRIAKNNLEIATNNAHPGNAGLLPSANLSTAYSQSTSNGSMLLSTGSVDIDNSKSTLSSASLGVNYALFSGGNNFLNYKKLKSLRTLGDYQTLSTIEAIMVQIIQSYYEISRINENVRISKEALKISRDRYQRVVDRVALGKVLSIERLSAEVDMNTDSMTVINTELQLQNTKRNLNYLLGREIDTEFQVNENVACDPRKTLEVWREKALLQNTGLLASRELLKQSEIDYSYAKSSILPMVSGQVSYGYTNTDTETGTILENESMGLTAGVNVSFDLFTGFRKKIQIQNSKVRIKSQEESVEQTQQALEKDIKNAYAIYENNLFTVKIEEKNLKTALLNFDRTKELYTLGQVTTTQFREAQLNWIRAESRLINARFTTKYAEIELYRLSGQLLDKFSIKS